MTHSLAPGQQPFDVGDLKDRNLEMIWRLLDRIANQQRQPVDPVAGGVGGDRLQKGPGTHP